jgi:S1-C subfamily serine protease
VRLASDAPIGSTATVVVIRDGKQVTLKIPVAQREN